MGGMMRNSKLIISAAIAVNAILGTGAALAADLAARPYTKAPAAAPVMTYHWTGCYIGGNVGGGWARIEQSRIGLANGSRVFPAQNYGSADGSSLIGGSQIGCDYQFGGNWVVGVQDMFDFGNINSSHIIPLFRHSIRRTAPGICLPRPLALVTCLLRPCWDM
jgi:outer membrane immunogenic protein